MTESPYDSIADLYDTYVQTALDVPFFQAEARKTSGEILELMAGTGRVTLPLVRDGARLTCVDNSAPMLAVLHDKLAQEKLTADVRHMDVRALDFGRLFDLIIIPFHAFAELPTPEDQRQTLASIYRHLSPAGRFICTLHNPPVRLRSVDGHLRLAGKHSLGEGRLLFWLLQTYDAGQQRIDVTEIFEEYDGAGRLTQRRLMELQARLLEKATFEALIGEAGFGVDNLYGNYDYAPFDEAHSPFMIWLLRK